MRGGDLSWGVGVGLGLWLGVVSLTSLLRLAAELLEVGVGALAGAARRRHARLPLTHRPALTLLASQVTARPTPHPSSGGGRRRRWAPTQLRPAPVVVSAHAPGLQQRRDEARVPVPLPVPAPAPCRPPPPPPSVTSWEGGERTFALDEAGATREAVFAEALEDFDELVAAESDARLPATAFHLQGQRVSGEGKDGEGRGRREGRERGEGRREGSGRRRVRVGGGGRVRSNQPSASSPKCRPSQRSLPGQTRSPEFASLQSHIALPAALGKNRNISLMRGFHGAWKRDRDAGGRASGGKNGEVGAAREALRPGFQETKARESLR